jgi:hypothetical protein
MGFMEYLIKEYNSIISGEIIINHSFVDDFKVTISIDKGNLMTLKEFAEQIAKAAEVSPDAEVVMWKDTAFAYVSVCIKPAIYCGKQQCCTYDTRENGDKELLILD